MGIGWKFLFPTLLLIGNLGSAGTFFLSGDWTKGVYWLASAVCIGAVAYT
jgi:hypothetical protein